jgi:two-component system NarL family sensor kinase
MPVGGANARNDSLRAEASLDRQVTTVEEPGKQPGSRTLQTVTRLAWAVGLLAVSLALLGLPLIAAGPPQEWVGNFLLTLALTATGLVIAIHRPHNPIGWLYSAAGLCQGLGVLTGAYVAYALVTRHGSLPAAAWVIWVSSWLWALGLLPVATFGFLLFPEGRLPSPRWRPVAWAIGLAIGLFIAAVAFLPGPMDSGLGIELANPLGIDPARSVLEMTFTVSAAIVGMSLIVSVGSLVLRWRRAWGDERQQLKWVAYAAALLVVLESISSLLPHKVFSAAVAVVALLVPAMIGVAILKYRRSGGRRGRPARRHGGQAQPVRRRDRSPH